MPVIEQSDWKRIEYSHYPEDVSTGGMGPCVGILIYDHDTRVTYGLHYPSPHMHEIEGFRTGLSNAFTEFATSSRVSVYISGCCDNRGAEVAKIRAFVAAELKQRATPTTNIYLMWPAPSAEEACLTLDPATGICDGPS
jgi:hypothetical protein